MCTCVTHHCLAEMARRKTSGRPGDDSEFQCSRQGCRTTGNGDLTLESTLAEYTVGCLCEIYSTRDGHARSDQGSWLRVRGAGNRERVGRADAHTHHVCSSIRPCRLTNPLIISSGPDEGQVARAKVLTEDLLEVVRAEHGKAQAALVQQQMELHQAQMQYAQYGAISVCLSTLTHLCRKLDTQRRILLLFGHRAVMVPHLHPPIMRRHHHRPVNNPRHLQVGVHLHLIPPRTHTLPTGTCRSARLSIPYRSVHPLLSYLTRHAFEF